MIPAARVRARSFLRSLPALLALALFPVAPALHAAPPTAASPALPPSALPPLPDQSDPWLYRGSDVPHDKEWYFGTLPNGLRWAVRHNGVPPGQVSIRIRMDVGSVNETPQEAGFAHLIEHLVFRQSRYLGEAQAIPTWQRLGATLGADTNAETTAIHTVFKIDLPDATPQTVDTSFKLLSGMMIAPTLSESDIRTEVPIVLAEKRERGGAAARADDASRETFFAGQAMADHPTIGYDATVGAAHEATVKAFHARWYRPENAAIIVAGDTDPRLMAALIAKWFGDWPAPGAHTPFPDLGAPKPADPASLVGPVKALAIPDLPRSLTYAIERPWHEKHDTIVYNQGLLADQVAMAIINRRLESRARAGADYLAAEVGQANEARSIDATFVSITPLDGKWQAALSETRGVIADALAIPPTPAEIAREVAEINVAFESQMQQQALQPGGRLADDLIQALDIHETVAAPPVVFDIFHRSIPLFTPAAIFDHTKQLFQGAAIRALYVTPQSGEADEAALKAALTAPAQPDPHARSAGKPISFADLPPIGKPAAAPVTTPTGLPDIEQLDFGNGVRALIWPTTDDPGRVTVKVRFGAGARAFGPGDAGAAALGRLALVSSGEGALGQEELDRAATGRKFGYEFKVDEGTFTFSADTRAEDLADQLYVFADKFAAPRWDAPPVIRARALAQVQYASAGVSPQGIIARDLKWLSHGKDPRYAVATPAALAATTPDDFRRVWAPILAQGPIEVQVFGDATRADIIADLAKTFGALPPRSPAPHIAASDTPALPVPTATPLTLTHSGDPGQAAAVVVWPTGGGVGGLVTSHQLDVLAQLFTIRLMDAMREKAGAAYSPDVSSDWPVDLAGGGQITAAAQVAPAAVPVFFKAVDDIAAGLASDPPSPDELARVVGPLKEQILRMATSTAFYMWQIEGSTRDPSRIAALHHMLDDYANVTPAGLQALARQYLVADKALRIAVVPAASSSLPPGPPPAGPAAAAPGASVPPAPPRG